MLNIDELKFDEKGLIPAVVVDSITKKVLTVAYMNRESLQISMEKGKTTKASSSAPCPGRRANQPANSAQRR